MHWTASPEKAPASGTLKERFGPRAFRSSAGSRAGGPAFAPLSPCRK